MHDSPPIIRQVEEFVRSLDKPPVGCVVAVSGGADSVALLRALLAVLDGVEIGPEFKTVVAHLNHQLRGNDSDADAEFVRELCTVLAAKTGRQIPFHCTTIPVAGRARLEKRNLEELARNVRYDWLAEVAQLETVSLVLTGHTADDQAETVLHRLIRGAGLRGLAGIAPRRPLRQGIELVRPMLSTTRSEILAYLSSIGQPFREDASNRDLRYTRNRIRFNLLPLLREQYNPEITSLLCRLSEQAAAAHRFLDRLAAELLTACERPRADKVCVFDCRPLASQPRTIVREMFRLVWRREGWAVGRMGFAAWDRLAGIALAEVRAGDFPGGIAARRQGRVVRLGPNL